MCQVRSSRCLTLLWRKRLAHFCTDHIVRLIEESCEQRIVLSQDNPLLTAFLDQSHYVIRAEMSQALPPQERKASRTSNLAHLLHKYKEGSLSPAFQTALSCLCQLGIFIKQYG